MTTSEVDSHLHENCLPPLILWLFYSLISQWQNSFHHLIASLCEEDALSTVSLGLFCFSTSFVFQVSLKSGCISACLTNTFICIAMFLLAKMAGAMVSRPQ